MENVAVLGIDIAKHVFYLVGMNEHRKVLMRKKLNRSALTEFITQVPQTIVAMEACAGAHHWARIFKTLEINYRLDYCIYKYV